MDRTVSVTLYSRELALLWRLAAAERVPPAELASRLVAKSLFPAIKQWGGVTNLPSLEDALRAYGSDADRAAADRAAAE